MVGGPISFENDGDVLWLCGHAVSDCERLQESPGQTLCRDSKSVLDRINQSDCVGLHLLLTMETKTTQPGQGWGGTGRSESSVIKLHPLIIYRDTYSHAWHAELKDAHWEACIRWLDHSLLTLQPVDTELTCSILTFVHEKWHLNHPLLYWRDEADIDQLSDVTIIKW